MYLGVTRPICCVEDVSYPFGNRFSRAHFGCCRDITTRVLILDTQTLLSCLRAAVWYGLRSMRIPEVLKLLSQISHAWSKGTGSVCWKQKP
jgi:hypothetical protein